MNGPSEPQDIDAAFEKFRYQHPFIDYDLPKHGLTYCLRIAYLAGLSDGVEKAASVYRGMDLAAHGDELTRRLASSTVPEQLAANLERMDVRA